MTSSYHPTLSSYLASHPDFDDPSSSSSPLPSLYASLAQLRSSNPAAYRSNLDWWKTTLADVTWQGSQRNAKGKAKQTDAGAAAAASATPADRLVLKIDEEMLDSWTLEEVGRPMGIATVVLDLAATHELTPLSQYLNSTSPIAGPSRGKASWIPSAGTVVKFVVGKPLWWAMSNMGLTSSPDEEQDEIKEWKRAKGSWVVWENLEKAAEALLSDHFAAPKLSPLESLFTLEAFKTTLRTSQPHLSETDVRLVLKYLSRDRRVAAVEKGIVKLSHKEHEEVKPITEQDRELMAIKETHQKLEVQIADIEKRIEDRTAKVTLYLKQNQKPRALTSLKEKKMLSELLNKRLGSKETLDSILLQIEQAAGDVEILASYETSTSVLKSILARPELQSNRVDATMIGLEDAMADAKEIDDAVREGGNAAVRASGREVDVDEKELEEEMKMLEEEEKKERAAEEERQRRLAVEEEARRKEEEIRKKAEEERKAQEAKQREEERKKEEEEKKKKKAEAEQAEKDKADAARLQEAQKRMEKEKSQAEALVMED